MFFSGSETNINPYNPFFFYGVELQYCIYQYIDACLGVRAERSKQEECIFHFEQSVQAVEVTLHKTQAFFFRHTYMYGTYLVSNSTLLQE